MNAGFKEYTAAVGVYVWVWLIHPYLLYFEWTRVDKSSQPFGLVCMAFYYSYEISKPFRFLRALSSTARTRAFDRAQKSEKYAVYTSRYGINEHSGKAESKVLCHSKPYELRWDSWHVARTRVAT